MKVATLSFMFVCLVAALMLGAELGAAHYKQSKGHVKIKVWRGPSHGYKKHKYAPFGYHFSVDEKGHY